jgi:hypothetical protein
MEPSVTPYGHRPAYWMSIQRDAAIDGFHPPVDDALGLPGWEGATAMSVHGRGAVALASMRALILGAIMIAASMAGSASSPT